MDKRLNPKQSNKPSKFLMFLALIIAFSLPYYLVKNFSHHKKNGFTHQDVSLPRLEIEHVKEKEKPLAIKPKDNQWHIVKPRVGDSMAAIFNRLGLSAKNLQEVLYNNPHSKVLTAIKPNQPLQFLINKNQLDKLIIPVNNMQTLTIYRTGTSYKTQIDYKKMKSQNNYITATLKGSLSDTARRMNIPNKLVQQMTTIFNKKIDFSRSTKVGDQFSIIYEGFYVDDKLVATGDILAITYTNRGKTFKAIRHTDAQGGHDYFTPKGTSLKKAFTRYPIRFSHISSPFSLSRQHPILHYQRAHKGIDLAASIGTPIRAIGDGVIADIGRHNGYGNMIKIKHDKTYSTVYAHMLRFQKGVSKGTHVRRNQVIGYVGQTGLASGPHCHFELHVNDIPRNPTTIALPTAASIPAREIAAFKAQSNTLLARLKLFEEATLAASGRKNIDIG
ncbi:MAG: peptidoglycan DD-metalloendopeptidase family protein [Legionella sp.]|nr:peptidoglycan DD-metalloendopeptidase family protein [Legionella sp.]